MPRKRTRTATNESGKRKQFNVSFTPKYGARLEETAEALGLDGVSLIRMIVHKHISEYEQQAQAIRESETRPAK